ncbi:MAG: right-handed parallel beta-helix repeat-containing protein [Planctomycetes bacterium]|nr:right-handed parallel beta-helix repeat-containing protein [Planctomycetota bacterium]
MAVLLVCFLLFAFACSAAWSLDRQAPPLAAPSSGVQWVRDTHSLENAVNNARTNTTIMIADGTYQLKSFLRLQNARNVTIRGASGDPTKVIIRGNGFDRRDEQDDILRIDSGENITVAYITFSECHSYGVKVSAGSNPKNIHIYNCHFRDIAMRMIKGAGAQDGHAVGGSIRYCHFENTKVPQAGWLSEGNYITAIDMMTLDGWSISDNTFVNIKGRTGNARAAVFVWVRSRNITVERNLFIDCDRCIAFGNISAATATRDSDELHCSDCVARNNFIIPGPDAGIEVAHVDGIRLYNNTIWRRDGGRGIRCIGTVRNVEITNNIVRGDFIYKDGVKTVNNVMDPSPGIFVNAAGGDFHLTPLATAAINRGVPVDGLKDDFDGFARDQVPDIGAAEFGARPAAEDRPSSGGKALVRKDEKPSPEKLIAARRDSLAAAAALLAAGDAAAARSAYGEVAAALKDTPAAAAAVELLASSCSLAPDIRRIVIEGSSSGEPVKVYVDFGGMVLKGTLVRADDAGIVVRSAGGSVPLEWAEVSPGRLAAMARKLAASAAQRLAVAEFGAACGSEALAAEESASLSPAELSDPGKTALESLRLLLPAPAE